MEGLRRASAARCDVSRRVAASGERSSRTSSGPPSRHELPPHRSPRLWDAHWLLPARLTYPPFVGSRRRLTKPPKRGMPGPAGPLP
jgi:hypothetical protein